MSEELFEKNAASPEETDGNKDNETFNRPKYTKSGGSYPSRYTSGKYTPRGSYSPRGSYGERGGNGERTPYGNSYGAGREGYQPRPFRPRYDGDGDYQARNFQQGPRYGKRPAYGNQGDFRGPRYGNRGGYQRYNGGYQSGGADYHQEGGGFRQGAGGFRQGGGGYPARNGGMPRYGMRGNGYRRPYYDNGPRPKYSLKKRLEYQEENFDPNAPVRLNKFLANAGVCSRRDADKYIQSGVVTVNGNVVTELGTKVLRSDEVKFHDQPVKMEKKVYILLNKPKGYVTTSEDPQNRKTVMDLVRNACPERIYPVGRLDRNTTGVLLLTNDGELASKLTHPKFLKKKIYHVFCDKSIAAADLHQIAEGITLEDGEIKADHIEYCNPESRREVGIEIHSGKNRIVRRIFESLGYHVTKLDRVYFAGLTKKNLRRGDWRYLTEQEVNMLRMGAFE